MEFEELKIVNYLIDSENENKLVKIINLTSNSVELELVRNTRWFNSHVLCNKCQSKHVIEHADKTKKLVCYNQITINKGDEDILVTCGGKAFTETHKDYTGLDRAWQWFVFDKTFKERFKLQS